MTQRDDRIYLFYVLEAIERIERHMLGRGYQDLLDDELLEDAVVRQLMIIGEAIRNISAETKDTHPHVPWRDIVATRNRVVHLYFEVDIGVVWSIVSRDLQPLKRDIRRILDEQ